MRLLTIIIFIALSAYRSASEAPRIEIIHREATEVRLMFVNDDEKDVFLSPYLMIEEFYERPACDDCATGWIATRPRRLPGGPNLIRVVAGESLEFDSPLSPLRPTRVSVYAAKSASAKKSEFQPIQVEIPVAAKNEEA